MWKVLSVVTSYDANFLLKVTAQIQPKMSIAIAKFYNQFYNQFYDQLIHNLPLLGNTCFCGIWAIPLIMNCTCAVRKILWEHDNVAFWPTRVAWLALCVWKTFFWSCVIWCLALICFLQLCAWRLLRAGVFTVRLLNDELMTKLWKTTEIKKEEVLHWSAWLAWGRVRTET